MFGSRAMSAMERAELARTREAALRGPGLADLAASLRRDSQRPDPSWQRQDPPLMGNQSLPKQGSLLGNPPQAPWGFDAVPQHQKPTSGAGREAPMEAYHQTREVERHLDFHTGTRHSYSDAPVAAPTYTPPIGRGVPGGSDGRRLSLEQERLERERQRQADLQRRAELQRELERERDKIRLQKEKDQLERKRREELQRKQQAIRQAEERARVREQELKRAQEKEAERRRIQREREETEREIERKKALIEERGAKLQQEIRRNQEMRERERLEELKKQQEREHREREQREREQREQGIQRAREIQMIRNQEEAIKQQMALKMHQQQQLLAAARAPQQMMMAPPQQAMIGMQYRGGIPSLLSMPKVTPTHNLKEQNSDTLLMERVKIQQALLAKQSPGQGQKQNQNRSMNRNKNHNQNQAQNRNQNQTQNRNQNQNQNQNQNRNQTQNPNRKQRRNRKRKSRWSGDDKALQTGNQGQNQSQSKNHNAPQSKHNQNVQSSKVNQTSHKSPKRAGDAAGEDVDLYDPLHPTDDDNSAVEGADTPSRKRKKSDESKELQVRIEQGKESRDVIDPPAKKKMAATGDEMYEDLRRAGCHPADDMITVMRKGIARSLEWFCHACCSKCPDVMAYHKHMMGKKHQVMMAHLLEVCEASSTDALKALQSDYHLARVQQGYKSVGATGSNNMAHFCQPCTMYIFGNLDDHLESDIHKNSLDVKEQKCKICNKASATLKEFMDHCNSMAHKMLFELHMMNEQRESNLTHKSYVKEKRERSKALPKLFVTVDEVGFEAEGKEDKPTDDDDIIDPVTNEPVDKARLNKVFDSLLQKNATPTLVSAMSEAIASSDAPPKGDQSPTRQLGSTEPSVVPGENLGSPGGPITAKMESTPWSKDDLNVYDFNKIVGQEYVIPVTGFFCKLCRKFYNSENSARVIHCKSRAHFQNLKKLFEEMKHAAELARDAEGTKKTEGGKKEGEIESTKNREEIVTKEVEGKEDQPKAAARPKDNDPKEEKQEECADEVIKIEDDNDEVMVIPDDEDVTNDSQPKDTTVVDQGAMQEKEEGGKVGEQEACTEDNVTDDAMWDLAVEPKGTQENGADTEGEAGTATEDEAEAATPMDT